MMKKTYSRKSMIGIFVLGISLCVFCLMALTYFLTLYFGGLRKIDIGTIVFVVILGLFGFIMFSALLVLCVFALNRASCKVMYDSNTQTIHRKGFICGYNYELKVEDIKDIFVAPLERDGIYFIIIDDFNYQYGLTKKSYIQLEKTKYNHMFIKQFWDKPIKEYNYLHPIDGPTKSPINIIV